MLDSKSAPTPYDVNQLFVFPVHPTTLTLSDLWSIPEDSTREISYPGAREPDLNEHGLKGELPHHKHNTHTLWKTIHELANNTPTQHKNNV